MSQYITPRLLEELQSNDKLKRSATVTTIGSLITDLETNGKHGEENPVYIEIHEHLVRLLKSTATKDRLVCTSLLSALVGIEALETKQKVRMVVQLGNLLKSTDMAVCQDATEVYRQVLQRRWPEAMNSVGKDVEMCIQWLGNHSNKVRQLTALLLLDALSNHAPTSIYAHISRIFTLLGTPLKDKSLEVRLAAARSMGACLRLVPKQEHSPSGVLLSYLYEELQRDQKLGSAESSHAALLQCQELVQFGGSFMLAHFGYASELALSLKEHRDPVVRRAAIGLLPVLAKFSIDKFVTYTIGTDLLLTRSYEFLTKLVRANDNDCATALVALTQITQSSGSQFEQVLDETIMAICNVLEIRAKTRNASTVVDETDDAIFQAISELAATFGSALTQYTSKIMDLMFTVGLSNQLCNSLNALELYVGHLLPDIQDRLLDMISIILANMPFRSAQSFIDNLDARMGYVSLHYPSGEQSGESLKGSSWLDRKLGTGATSESASLVVSSAKKIVVTIDVLKLALNILGTFDFTGCNLSEFIYSTILQYLDHSDIDVRIEALTAVSKIILSNTIYGNIIVGGVKVTEEIVHRLMAMAVTESSDDVRLAAIRMLGKGSYFDFHLSSAQNIQSAYLLVNDENFDIRLAALQIIGRMANRNPAHVTTFLSTVITQLLHTFEHSTDAREREESIHSLAVLACSAEYWMRPYISLIFDVVFKHFDSSPPQLSVRLIDIMAALVQLGSHDLVPYLDKLLECLVHALSDQASAKKRLSAVVALGKCATFCNMTITPYVEYPQLFGLLAAMMKTEGNVIKQEVVRTIGALGAIDPLQYKDALATVDSESKVLDGFSTTTSNSVLVDCTSSKNTDSTKQSSKGKKAYKKRVGPAPNVMTVFNKENEQEYLVGDIHVDSYGVTFSSQPLYYISVAVNSLLRILDSPAESKSHLLAVQALNTMFAPMFNVCGVYMDRVIPSVLRAMKAAPPESAESYIERLGRLIGIAQELSRPYLGPIFDLFNVDGHISEKHQSALIDLVEPIEKAQGGDFGAHTTKVVQFLVSVTNHDNSPQHQLTLKALHVLCILKSSYEDNLFLIIPKLVNLLDVSTTPEDVVIKSLGCIQVSYSRGYSQVLKCQMLTELEEVITYKLSQQPALVYTYLKFKWEAKECANAFQMLEMFASDYSAKIGFDSQYPGDFISYTNRGSPSEYSIQFEENDDLRLQHLLARFYFKRAEWLSQIQHTGELAQEAHAKANLTGYAAGKDMGPNGRKSSVGNIGNHRSLNPNVVGTSSSTSDMSPSKHSASYAISAEEAQAVEDAEYLYSLKRDRINDVILESYHAAAILDSKWYKAWHFLALRHFQETQKHDIEHSMVSDDIVERHIVPSVHGFFRAIQLSKNDTTLQDTLRLLTVWFNYSEHESVAQAVIDGFGSVPLLTWVQVIPQILARIHLQPRGTSDLIKQLLVEIGKYHPHAVLFSLYVVARGNHKERSCIAKEILKRLHDISPQIVEETEVVSRELIRITLIFPEMWSAGLAQASAAYFEDNNIKEMMDILRPLHIRAENPETLREYHFVQMFRVEISYAQNYLKQYFSSETNRHNPDYIKLAWEVYTHIYNKIKNTMLDFDTLDLTDTAPELLKCHGMSLAVPGTYDPDRPTVRIESFVPMVKVYKTKQKPREIKICGSDGNKYTFVLKGNEDLRQDERAMQLFGLINSLLARNTETSRRSLAIERYPVIPLSSNSGLIGFYPGCENFSEIIKNYRKPRGIIENQEDRYLLQCYPNWDNISDKKKIQFFEYVHRSLPGDDLQKSMWYKSPNAEIWLQRRTNYTRSLAVMSMAGYILGLGDRHPTNMMLHMSTGKVVHIDFGDCFEIATQREKSPETVPFRLTRMFTMPMELGSIEGMFKFTANHTMQVLRSNRDSLMAVLEAFVFDPLVSWSYIGKADNKPAAGMATNNAAFANIDDKYWQRGNPKARAIVKRILDKLMGTDFDPNRQLEVSEQVNSLIEQATSPANLAVLYRGWMPFW
ncbi:phosphatidylinositol kinase- protein kinase tor1 [Coemansia sp. Benny D115]|nr:phosphatidylinositol kinase- protein kinase tor1 [Coemansia sp. Benny D115]